MEKKSRKVANEWIMVRGDSRKLRALKGNSFKWNGDLGCRLGVKLNWRLSSIQFSHSVASDSLWPRWLQHAMLPCPSPTPRTCSNSCPSSQWCHPIISSFVIHFAAYLQSFPASGSLLMSQFFASGGQNIRASASVLPMNIQYWFILELSGLISWQSKGLKSLLQHHSSKESIVKHSAFFMVQLSYPYMTTGKIIALTKYLCRQSNVSAF